ncbi:hypothetical protein ASZ78_003509 [Callipepla squamata]|uniref:Uncharacterized protein n=1 Tax=Callipepla squamata TaxID=9009 RepID=A0A226NHC2_CALSU|nr:hypothetical protein ASZ78_003509 [Callipepla squamata]
MESWKKRSKVISDLKQQDLHVELERELRKGSKQQSVRSAREQLEEVRDVTRLYTSKIYENFQQSKPEEPTSTAALPVKVVARSVDEIIASLQSASPSSSEHMIKELLESVLGQKYSIKMTSVVQKESRAAENKSQPSDELLTYNKQVKQFGPDYVMSIGMEKGVPVSELFQNNQKDGIHSLPPHTSKTLPECQKAESNHKKTQLQLIGEKNNVIEDITYEDFLINYEEELEAEQDDLDIYDILQTVDIKLHFNFMDKSVLCLIIVSVSLGRLLIHNKFIIKVSPAIKQYQSPSIPCLLDFEKFAKVRGGIPKETSARTWVSGIWNCWFDETFPACVPEEDIELLRGVEAVDSQETNLEIELVDSVQPILLEGAVVSTADLEEEVRRLTGLIEKVEHPSAFQYCRRGAIQRKLGKLKSAMDDLEKCFQYNPKRTDALMKHGIYFFDHSILATAVQDFTAVIREDPSNAQARLYRGRAYAKQQQYRNAIEDLTAAIHLDPSCWLAFYYKGCILRETDPKRALQDFSVSVLINDTKENFSSFLHRGIIYSKQHRWSIAIHDFECVIALNSSVIFAYLKIGLILLLHLDQYYEAIRQFTNAIKIDPLNVQAYLYRAQAYHKIHNLSNAVKDMNRAIHLYPDKAELQILRGQYLMLLKKYELARFCIHQLAKMNEGNEVTFCGGFLPESYKAHPVQYALIQSFCQNHSKATECLREAATSHPEPSMFVLLGKIQMKAGKTEDAVGSFKQAVNLLMTSKKILPPTFEAAEMYYLMGLCYMEQIHLVEVGVFDVVKPNLYIMFFHFQTFKAAIEDFSKMIDLDSTCILAYYNRAICHHQIKNFRKALKDYGISLLHELSKEIVLKVFVNRGLLYMELGDYANACEDFKEAALLSPGESQIFQAIGTCHYRLNEFEEAVRSFDQVLRLEPVSVEAYIGRGNSYMKNGPEAGLEQAQKDFLKAIHLNPMCVKARICLGYNLQALGKLQSAWNQLTAVIAIDSKCDAAYEGRASVSLQMGEIFSALQDTNTALKLTTTAPLLTNRGVINQLMGYLSCAMKDYQQAISVDPKYALAYFSIADIYFHNHQFSQAHYYYSEVLKLEPRNESAVMNRAVTNTILKNFEEAKEDFEKAVCLCPFSAALYFNRANFYNALKQYELAEKDISTALSIQPNDAMMYRLRADIRAKLGFSREAVEDYKQAISIQEQTDYM